MTFFWIVWSFVCLGVTAWNVDTAAHHAGSPAWFVLSGGCTLWSAFMVHQTWDD